MTALNSAPVRHLVEAAIESLIALLDAIDGDADLEPEWDDLGFDSDSEPDAPGSVPDYDPGDQRLLPISADSHFQLVFDVDAGVSVSRSSAEDERPAG